MLPVGSWRNDVRSTRESKIKRVAIEAYRAQAFPVERKLELNS